MATATKTRKTRTPAAAAKAEAKAAEKQARGASLKDELDAWLAEADEEDIEAALRKFSKDHGTAPANRFSGRNACLVVMQDEDATDVRSYLDWLDAGRRPRPRAEDSEGDGITIVGFRGDGKTKEGREQAEAAKAKMEPGEMSSDDLKKPRRFYDLRLVYDIRHTDPITCRECSAPIHRTGFDPQNKRFHTWTHTTVKADHTALPAPRQGKEEEDAAATA
jgi:hypothetical protein